MKQLLQNAADLDYDLDLDTMSDGDLIDIEGLGSYGDDEDGLGYVGLGKARRRGKKSRRSRGRRRGRKARAARKSRRRRSRKVRASRRRRSRRSRRARAGRKGSRRRVRRHRAAKVASKPRRRRRRKSAKKAEEAMAALGKPRRRRRRKASAAAPKRRRARRARRSRRSRSVAGIGVMGRALGKLANTVALQGLGKAGRKRRKSRRRKSRRGGRKVRAHRRRKHRRSGRKAHRRVRVQRRRRSGSRRRARRSVSGLGGFFKGLGSIGNMGAGLADAEVASSMYGVGAFQYLLSMPGLEALGGVGLGSIVSGLVSKGLFGKLFKLDLNAAGWQGVATRVGSGAVSAAAMWELGRLIGSGNVAKFGAFYALGRTLENELVNPYIMAKINPMLGLGYYGLGQARIPDAQELRDLGYLAQARIPDQDELRDIGQRIVTEEELLGGVGEEDDAAMSEDSNVF